MSIADDENIFEIISDIALQENVKVFLVGGYVRDIMLDRRSNDIDFVVEGDSLQFARIVAKRLNRKKVVEFPKFQTSKLSYKEYDLEFVTARKESYLENSRNPEVEKSNLPEDLKRRDFTINTLAIDLNDRENIINLFNGIEDIKSRIIRTPLDPDITYSDDPLRMLRAVRFASRFNFKIEKESFEAIKRNASRLDIVSEERISDEFFKILLSDYPVKGIYLLDQAGLLETILPELSQLKGIEILDGTGHKDNFIHTLKVLNNISKITKSLKLRLSALMHDIGKPKSKYFKKGVGWTFHGHDDVGVKIFTEIAKRLKWPNDITEYVSKMINLHHRPISLTKEEVTDSGVRRFLFEGGELVDDLMLLCRADITTSNKKKLNNYLDNFDKLSEKLIVVEEKDKLRNFKPPVNGIDIMNEFSINEGPIIGQIKKEIVDSIINGSIPNEKEAAMNLLKKIKARIEKKSNLHIKKV
ncbi:MAG: HD domain-containing protein [Candidatus Delongbacteria bacterium]|nr:HD domain-containing protein [Candidatus Delongbacteria bacterium]